MPEKATIHGFVVTRAEGLTPEQKGLHRTWVAELRSGNYYAVTGYLHTSAGYCCLGVVENILGADWEPLGDESTKGGLFGIEEEDYAGCMDQIHHLTRKTSDLLGQPSCVGFSVLVADDGRRSMSLAELNDESYLSFSEIADVIAYWAGLEEPAGVTVSKEEGERP